MKLVNPRSAIALVVLLAVGIGEPFAQQTPTKRNFETEINAALQAAKTAAGFEFLGTLVRTCLLPQSGGENLTDVAPPYVTDPSKAPPRETWFAEPAKVFDNLYFVGGKLHSAWALTTRDGIILIDTIYPYNSEELDRRRHEESRTRPGADQICAHLARPRRSHRRRRNACRNATAPASSWLGRIGTGSRNIRTATKPWRPKRDIVATDGMKITLGETTVTIWFTPGHTPGTMSYTFSVLDQGKPVNVAYSGGTAFNFVNNTPDPGIKNFQTYIDSQKHLAAKATETKASVLISNHSEFDNAVNKNRMLAGRGNGPHPYEIGRLGAEYFQVAARGQRS